MSLRIRPAVAGDRDAVCRLLSDKMNCRISPEWWRGIVDGRWAPWAEAFGVVAQDGQRLIGFLGVVYAQRPDGRRSGNLTSWYIEKPYRGRGLGNDMLRAAISEAEVTYTTFSSTPTALRLMKRAGLEMLDDRRFIWEAGYRFAQPTIEVLSGVSEIEPHLSSEQVHVLADHAGLNLRPYLIRYGRSDSCLVLLHVKEKGADIAYYEVLHVGEPAVFSRHAGAFAAAILPPKQAVLSVDSRFLTDDAKPHRVEPIVVPRYYRPVGMGAQDVDFLYSEIVLLDLKLY